MDDATDDAWSAVAADWADLWGDFADPARRRIIDLTGIRPGSRVLDVGCGSGEFLALLEQVGALTAGIDPAQAMIAAARPFRAAGGGYRLVNAFRFAVARTPQEAAARA